MLWRYPSHHNRPSKKIRYVRYITEIEKIIEVKHTVEITISASVANDSTRASSLSDPMTVLTPIASSLDALAADLTSAVNAKVEASG